MGLKVGICGTGSFAPCFIPLIKHHPQVERVTIAEIEPLVPEVVSTYFSEHNYDVVRNPKVRVQIDDAIEAASECPGAPYGPIELRPVMGMSEPPQA